MNPLVAPARRLAHRVWSLRVRASLSRTDSCRMFDLDLRIEPGVLHPRHFVSSRRLAQYVTGLELAGRDVADLGTGSGLLGLLAARAGARVTALDLNPVATACAEANARRNGLEGAFTAFTSDGFDALPDDRRFDLVISNPPFYSREAVGPSDQAFAGGDQNRFFAKLARSLPARLSADGVLVLILSSDVDVAPISRMFEETGLAGRVRREHRGLFETLTVREFGRI